MIIEERERERERRRCYEAAEIIGSWGGGEGGAGGSGCISGG